MESVTQQFHQLCQKLLQEEFAHQLADDLLPLILQHSSQDPAFIIDRYRQDDDPKWDKLYRIFTMLQSYKDIKQVDQYLGFVNTLVTPSLPRTNGRPESLVSFDSPGISERRSVLSDRRSIISGKSFARYHHTLGDLSVPYFEGLLSEDEILDVLSYTLLDTTSTIFPLGYNKLDIPVNTTNGDSGILHCIMEMALIYQFLQHHVGSFRDDSQVKLAIVSHLKQELRMYMGVVNGLQATSVRGVYLELFDYIVKFRIYYHIIQNIGLETHALLSELYDLTHHGDELFASAASSLFDRAMEIYNTYLLLWINKGVAENGDFFITAGSFVNVSLSFDIPVVLHRERIPQFFDPHQAEKIYHIGKGILFLEKYCQDYQWLSERAPVQHVFLELFDETVNTLYLQINARVNLVLREKFKYIEVLHSLKDMLLMGKSDFIHMIMKRSMSFLGDPSHSLPSYKLTRALQDSVHFSSLRGNPHVDKLDARLLELGQGTIGWDVFTLDYLIDVPLSVVINVNREKKEYLRIFNFLWRFKRNNFAATETWQEHMSLVRRLKRTRNPEIKEFLQKVSKVCLLRHSMLSFCKKLETHCFQGIIEPGFEKLMESLQLKDESFYNDFNVIVKNGLKMVADILKPKTNSVSTVKSYNVDELEQIHQNFLDMIVGNKLMNAVTLGYYSQRYYPVQIISLLNLVLEFLQGFSELNLAMGDLLVNEGYDMARVQIIVHNLVLIYRRFDTESYVFIRDLRSDEEMVQLSRLLR